MKETLKLGIILLIITVVSAGVLAVSNNLTKDQIAQLKIENTLAALDELFEDGYEFEALDTTRQDEIISENPEIVEIFKAYLGEEVAGYAIKTVTGGYDGDLTVFTGISVEEDEIVGMRLLDHSETPTLGGKAEEPEFYERFNGKTTNEEVEVEAISGATVTSEGVEDGVNLARNLYNNVLSE